MTSQFKLTQEQEKAQNVLAGLATHLCLFGGSRSGKTFLIVRNMVLRAIKAPGSRHGVFRLRLNALKASIFMDTFPKVMKLAFPVIPYNVNKSDLVITFNNKSEVWFCGLDNEERAEKILGMEFATLYFNECSQIPQRSKDLALTRLAQRAEQNLSGLVTNSYLIPRAYYDANPPSKAHWLYRTFIEKVSVDTRMPLSDPHDYVSYQINPIHNMDNLSEGYIKSLESMPERMKRRFLYGDFADATPNALFPETTIDSWRVEDGIVPDMLRIVVAVDPSGAEDTDNEDNDAIGIMVVGLGLDGNAYVLEDCTVKAGPATWGKVVTSAFDRHQADLIVGEINYGGAMVGFVVRASKPSVPFKTITSSRGKKVRAEPFSYLYEQGKIRHVGRFIELEDELNGFSTSGYMGDRSPNRADALIFALSELYPGVIREKTTFVEPPIINTTLLTPTSWMS